MGVGVGVGVGWGEEALQTVALCSVGLESPLPLSLSSLLENLG